MTDYNLQKYATLVRLNPDDPEAHFGYGFALEEKGELQPALKEYNAATKINPKHSRSYLHQGFITAISGGDLDYAVKMFSKAHDLDPNLAMVFKDPTNARFYAKRMMDALEKFQGPAIRNPNDGHAHLLLGKAYRFFDKPEMALASLKKCLDINNRLWEAYDESGQIYAQLGQNQQAIINFQRAVEANPKYADALYNLGVLYDKEGNTAMAIRMLQRSLEIDSHAAKAHYALGKAFMRQGKTMMAIKALQQAIDLDKDNPKISFALAQACESIYRLEFAAQMYERAIELDNRFAEAYYQLGMIYLQTARIEEAIEALENVVRINPTDAYAYYHLAEAYRKAGESDKAIAHYYNAIGLNPKDAFAHYNLGLVYAQTSLHDKAIEEYLKALELKPQDAHFHRDLAASLRALGRFQEAIRELENTVEVNPNDAESQLALAIAYKEGQRVDVAVTTLQKVLQVRPDYMPGRELLAECFVLIQAWDYAFEELQKIIQQEPKNAKALTELGYIYLNERKMAESATEYLQRAVQADPALMSARIRLAEALYQTHREMDAFATLEEAFKLQPTNADVLVAYAKGLEKQGKRDEAIRQTQKATNLAPKNARVWAVLADLYEHNGQINLAIEHYLEALTHDPEEIAFMMSLARLYVRLDKIEEAKSQYVRVLNLQMGHPEAEAALEALYAGGEAAEVVKAAPPVPEKARPAPAPTPAPVVAETPSGGGLKPPPPPVAAKKKEAPPAPPPPRPEPATPVAPAAVTMTAEEPVVTTAPPPPAPEPTASAEAVVPTPSGPMNAMQLKSVFRKAVIAHSTGKLDEAQTLLERVLQENPDHYQSYYYMGLMAKERGDRFQARMLFDQGLDLSSQSGDTEFYNLFETEMGSLKNETPSSRRAARVRSTPAEEPVVAAPAPARAEEKPPEPPPIAVPPPEPAVVTPAAETTEEPSLKRDTDEVKAEAKHDTSIPVPTVEEPLDIHTVDTILSEPEPEPAPPAPRPSEPVQENISELPTLLLTEPEPEPEPVVAEAPAVEPVVEKAPEPEYTIEPTLVVSIPAAEETAAEPEFAIEPTVVVAIPELAAEPAAAAAEDYAIEPTMVVDLNETASDPIAERLAMAPPTQKLTGMDEVLAKELHDQLEMARDFLDLGKLDRAAAKVEKALEMSPRHIPTLEMLADIRVAQGRMEDAVALWEQSVAFGGASPVHMLLKMGRSYDKAGQTDKARDIYMKALDMDDSNIEVVQALCRVSGVEADSMAFVQKLLKERPTHLALTLKLGHVYRQKAKYSLAVVQYNKALRLKEGGQTYSYLARSYDKLGKRDSSVKAWENAARLMPDKYMRNYQRSLEELVAEGDVETARASVESLIESGGFDDAVQQRLRESLNPDLPPRTEVPPFEEDEVKPEETEVGRRQASPFDSAATVIPGAAVSQQQTATVILGVPATVTEEPDAATLLLEVPQPETVAPAARPDNENGTPHAEPPPQPAEWLLTALSS